MATLQLLVDIEVLAHTDYLVGSLNSGLPHLIEAREPPGGCPGGPGRSPIRRRCRAHGHAWLRSPPHRVGTLLLVWSHAGRSRAFCPARWQAVGMHTAALGRYNPVAVSR